MDKGQHSELLLLCTQTAPQLRRIRSVQQFENDNAGINLQQQLDWLTSNNVMDGTKETKRKEKESKSKIDQLNKVPRPMNSFMVFSHLERKRLAEENPELHNADLSKILGRKWKTLNPAQRQPYIDEAERLRVLHTETFPDYKYKPRRRKHPKRNTKKFSTLSANDVKAKTRNALNLQCALPAASSHPLENTIYIPLHISPSLIKAESNLEISHIPPTPGDSPGTAPDFLEVKLDEDSDKHHIQQEGIPNVYSFLPLTPELSPQVAHNAVNRITFNFDPAQNTETELSIKPDALFDGLLAVVSSCESKIVANVSASLPTMSSFGTVYSAPEGSVIIASQQREPAPKVELFSDVDRDEFDQYLAPLERTQLSNSLRCILADLEDN